MHCNDSLFKQMQRQIETLEAENKELKERFNNAAEKLTDIELGIDKAIIITKDIYETL